MWITLKRLKRVNLIETNVIEDKKLVLLHGNTLKAYFAPILRCQYLIVFLTPTYKLTVSCSSPQVQVWDTAGQERFRKSMVEHYYRNVHAVVFVYDVTKMASFRNLQTWIEVGIW